MVPQAPRPSAPAAQLAVALVAVALAGCVSLPRAPTPDLRARFGRIQLVTPTPAPGATRIVIKSGRGEALPSTTVPAPEPDAGDAVIAGGALAGVYATIAPFPPLGVLVVASGLVVGGALASAERIDREAQAALDAQLVAALTGDGPDDRLAIAVERAAAALPQARAHGVTRAEPTPTTRLELRALGAGFRGPTDGGGIALYLVARSRLLDADGAVLHARDYLHSSAPRPLAAWRADGGAAIRPAVDEAFAALAARVVEELFVTSPFPFPGARRNWPSEPGFGACGLAPIDPPLRFDWPVRVIPPLTQAGYERVARDMIAFPRVASLTPTLRWEAFPRPRDRTPENAALIARISGVVYDLKVWEAVDGQPGPLVYERRGLARPDHELEQPLRPERDHYWSFRARYALDGAPQATRWAYSFVPQPAGRPLASDAICELDAIPPANHHRFTTRGTRPAPDQPPP